MVTVTDKTTAKTKCKLFFVSITSKSPQQTLMWSLLLQHWNYWGTRLRTKLKYWLRNNQWLRSQALIETLINDPGTETGRQCLHVNTKVSTRAVSSNSNSIFYQGQGRPIMGHNQVWWVIHMVFVHFTCITYWLQHGFESILVSIFDHLIDITFRIVYQQAHCHWSSLFALCFIPIDRSDTLFAKPQMSWPCLDMLQLFMNRQIKAPYYVLMAPPVELRDKYHILPANF